MADSSGTHLWLVLMKAYRSMARHAQSSIAAHDIRLSDFAILEALLHKGPMLVNEIGRRIELPRGCVTTPLERPEARAPGQRFPNDADPRLKHGGLARRARVLMP